MTKFFGPEVALKGAEPLVHQPAPEIQLGRRKVQGGARASFSTADRDHDAGRLDVVAGSEFLDDRIRLRE
jgi:hypothetical protein